MLGPSGSGKSTFLRCINHLEKINAGRLSVDGELVGYREHGGKLHELHEREIARKRAEIGMVFQHFNLFPHMTALENVTLAPIQVAKLVARRPASGRRAARPRRPRRQARHLPAGAVGRPAAAGGDRAGAGDAAEADAVRRADLGARPELVGDVLDAMRQLAADGMTMIVVTHELGFAREVGDTAVFMDAGVVVESGPPQRGAGVATRRTHPGVPLEGPLSFPRDAPRVTCSDGHHRRAPHDRPDRRARRPPSVHRFRDRGQGPVRRGRPSGQPLPASGRARPVPVHARRARRHVPPAAVDDAPVRRLRERPGIQRALPLPARARLHRAEHGLRPAHPARARLR